MLQSPYFFFDVVYLHNGTEEPTEDASWKVWASYDSLPPTQVIICLSVYVFIRGTKPLWLYFQDVYTSFSELDSKGMCYQFEVSLCGPAIELHNCMAKLLCHPLQRPFQSHASYSLLEEDDTQENEATVWAFTQYTPANLLQTDELQNEGVTCE